MENLEETRERLSKATMFISFDLVNCTLFKSRYKGDWASSVSRVLEQMMRAFVQSKVGGYRFWKTLGDEVVYTREIENLHEIAAVLDDIYWIVRDINAKLARAEIGDARTAEVLSVKATAWIADITPAYLSADNIYIKYETGENEWNAEYLGTDIDAGFRVAQYTSSNRLVVSADLAALFLREEALRKEFHKFNFVAFRILKGIWNGHPYPIFMYHGDESISFKDSIVDLSNEKMAILEDYLEQVPQRFFESSYSSYEEQVLDTLYRDEKLANEVNQIIGIVGHDEA